MSTFLGIIVHYDDTLLSNYYFLDPQYLAELLGQLIACERTNGLARHGTIPIWISVILTALLRIDEDQ
jgi:hypothetical protein